MPAPSYPPRRRCLLAVAGMAAAALAGPVPAAVEPPPRRRWPAGRATPRLILPGHDGPAWSLAAARGQVVLLNFWASWCEPCLAELPSLERLAQRHAREGLQVLAVNHRESEAAIVRFLARQPTRLTVLRDADGAAARAFGVNVFPTTVAIDRHGRASFSVVGETDWSDGPASAWVAELL